MSSTISPSVSPNAASNSPPCLDVAGDLDRDRAARAAHAEILVERAALVEDDRHRGERDHVVDDRRLAEQALVGRQRRLGADQAALALQRFEQRGLLAADIGAGADAHFHVEGVRRAEHALAQHARPPRHANRFVHGRRRMRIFRADIDEALGRADRDSGNRHAFDQDEGITLHDHAIGEGAAVAFVGIADDVFADRPSYRAPSST